MVAELTHEFRAPLIALVVALLLRLLGGAWKRDWLAMLAAGAGLFAGWWVLVGHGFAAGPLLAPHSLADRLSLLALIGMLAALASGTVLAGSPALAPIGLALFAGWWLAGGPHSPPALGRTWPAIAGVALAVWAACRLLEEGDFWRALAAALTLCISLYLVGAAPVWLLLAVIPAAALVALAPGPRVPAGALLPVASGMMVVASAAVLAAGRLPHGGIGRIDVAAITPLLVLWLPSWLGRAAPPVALLLAMLIALALTMAAGHVLAHN